MPPSRHNSRYIVKLGMGATALFVLTCVFLSQLGYRINSTPSLPEGIWKVRALAGPAQRGQIVNVAPPNTDTFKLARERHYVDLGMCAGGFASLLKPVAAISGDHVAVSAQGIAVNGVLIANSKALIKDSAGRPLKPVKPGIYTVGPGTVWLISDCARSFDSRYFGALPSANILGTAKPIWITEKLIGEPTK